MLSRLAPVVVLITLICGRVAHADNVSSLIEQLKTDDSDKIRLSAALNLAKLGDQKAILPLAGALVNDSDENVRAASAVALGKLVTSSTKPAVKSLAIANLKRATSDASASVKQQAQKALTTITGQSAGGTTTGGGGSTGGAGGGIYVNIGPMSSKTTASNNAKLQALMMSTTQKTLGKVATKMATSWPGGAPSKSVLAQKSVSGFYIDGTLNALVVKVAGSSSTITCKVSMLLADFPDKNMFGFLNGGASVSASASEKDQALASEDCVTAVIEDLVAKKIVPTICSKTAASCP